MLILTVLQATDAMPLQLPPKDIHILFVKDEGANSMTFLLCFRRNLDLFEQLLQPTF